MSSTSFRNVHIVSDTAHLSEDTIQASIKQFQNSLAHVAYILHDKDIYSAAEAKKAEHPELAGQLKPAHYHVVMAFKNPIPTKNIANSFGIAENFIENVKHSLTGAFLYLVHARDPKKYQYDPAEVHANFKYGKFVEEEKEKMERAALSQAKKKEKEEVERICAALGNGTMKAYQLTEIDPVLYAKNKTLFDNALHYHSLKLSGAGNDRQMDVIFITGTSGSGKTTYAKEFAKSKGYHYYLSGGNRDPLENYRGEECIIFDDLRGSSFRMSELLNILDNNTFSPIGSRYHNKTPEAKLIIITSITTVDKFYETIFENNDEPLVQLRRRCATYLKMDKESIRIFKYNSLYQDYVYVDTIVNPIPAMFPKQFLEDYKTEEAKDKVKVNFTLDFSKFDKAHQSGGEANDTEAN